MLKFNTFRALRYLRSRFIEGKFLLASEGTDIELELLDQMRKTIEDSIGNIAIADAFKVERLTDTTLLIKPGEAWFKGLPFSMRGGKDHLTSGTILSLGIAPLGTTIVDDATGLGKVLTFNDGATTPTGIYRIVLDAREENITNVDDPFIKNANITESTAQKMRLNIRINVVLESVQSEVPTPYTNDNTDENLINQVIVTPTAAGNGELLSTTATTGGSDIDGRDVELIVRNDPGVGSGNPLPNGSSDQESFTDGRLIDSNGSIYHLNAIFNDTVSTNAVLRIDKEVGQENPVLTNTIPYTVIKRDVYATDSTNGNPLGKLFYPIANLDWDSTDGVVHSSKVTDLRSSILSEGQWQDIVNQKFDLHLLAGGTRSYDIAAEEVTGSSAFSIINPHGPEQTIAANTAVIAPEGSIAYFMDLDTGGAIEVGNLAVTSTSSGTTVSFSGAPDLSAVSIGNMYKVGSDIAEIIDIDDVNDIIEVAPAVSTTGAATIYRDSYAPGTLPTKENIFILASRKTDEVSFIDGTTIPTVIYNEELLVVGGAPGAGEITGPIVAGTAITLPSGETYIIASDELKVYKNGLFQSTVGDYTEFSVTEVKLTFDLIVGARIRFRKN